MYEFSVPMPFFKEHIDKLISINPSTGLIDYDLSTLTQEEIYNEILTTLD